MIVVVYIDEQSLGHAADGTLQFSFDPLGHLNNQDDDDRNPKHPIQLAVVNVKKEFLKHI
jgi:hypothetical protein